ncbi:MAG TPA: hypothetical protein VHW24_15010 [Bryobacteraceae bacterium]|nr:hypothetical protein [Bryobacteraceae bacterium]
MRRAVWAALSVVMAAAVRLGGQPAAVAVAPSTMQRTGTVDERFQSYNVEMIELTGGRFWKPYADIGNTPASAGGRAAAGPGADLYEYRPPIDLTNPRLRKLAAALGPAYMRISGTWSNSVYFHDSGYAGAENTARRIQRSLDAAAVEERDRFLARGRRRNSYFVCV